PVHPPPPHSPAHVPPPPHRYGRPLPRTRSTARTRAPHHRSIRGFDSPHPLHSQNTRPPPRLDTGVRFPSPAPQPEHETPTTARNGGSIPLTRSTARTRDSHHRSKRGRESPHPPHTQNTRLQPPPDKRERRPT